MGGDGMRGIDGACRLRVVGSHYTTDEYALSAVSRHPAYDAPAYQGVYVASLRVRFRNRRVPSGV